MTFNPDIKAKNSRIDMPYVKLIIASNEADTINNALRILLAAMILERYLIFACS